MSDSARYSGIADQMLRLAGAALTEFERNGYLELSRAWRRLAYEAEELEGRTAEGIDGRAAPPGPDAPDGR